MELRVKPHSVRGGRTILMDQAAERGGFISLSGLGRRVRTVLYDVRRRVCSTTLGGERRGADDTMACRRFKGGLARGNNFIGTV